MFLKAVSCGAVVVGGLLAVGLHHPPVNGCPGARLLALACVSAAADEKKDDKPALSGAWTKKDAELKIEFVDGTTLKIAPHGDSAVIGIVCDYTLEKGGLVKAKVTGHEGKAEAKEKVKEHLPVGLEFSFKWTAKKDAAKLDDVKGDKIPDKLKTHLEGDFEKK